MTIIYWLILIITVLEFIASPVNTLINSKPHLQRLREVDFPISLAKVLAVVEIFAVSGVLISLWIPPIRTASGAILAFCFLPILVQAIRKQRPIGDLFGLIFFMACALFTALYHP